MARLEDIKANKGMEEMDNSINDQELTLNLKKRPGSLSSYVRQVSFLPLYQSTIKWIQDCHKWLSMYRSPA